MNTLEKECDEYLNDPRLLELNKSYHLLATLKSMLEDDVEAFNAVLTEAIEFEAAKGIIEASGRKLERSYVAGDARCDSVGELRDYCRVLQEVANEKEVGV